MVQEKNKKTRGQELNEFLEREHQKMVKNTIRIKWQVIEHTPGYNTGGYYDQDIPAKNVVVKDECKTEAEARAWMDRHEPDKGKSLHIQMRRLVRRYYDSWV